MTPVTVAALRKSFGSAVALRGVDLQVRAGELFFLLGASGCGKTTLLRCIAGFCPPDSGSVHFGEEEVTHTPPHRRQTGMVFQSYALWPHMTVLQNVSFGLEERRLSRAEVRTQAMDALAQVRMEAYAERSPHQLSGGQQQRVALARAMVIRPRCLLLDEPLSNLDAKLRLEMRAEIRRVCRASSLTAIYVTHDQKEALSIADRLAVMEAGGVLQVGTPEEVYRRPLTRSVAGFIGETNFLSGVVEGTDPGGSVRVETPQGRMVGVLPGGETPRAGDAVTLSVRPECWRLAQPADAVNLLRGAREETTYLGELAQHTVRTGERLLKFFELNPRASAPPSGRELALTADPQDVVVLTR